MADQDYATVSGTTVHRSDFAYAPAGSEPREWKLPIHDESHVHNALARFNQTELPAEAKAAALAKIHAAAKKFGIDAKEQNADGRRQTVDGQTPIHHLPSTVSDLPSSGFQFRVSNFEFPVPAVLLTGEGTAVETPADMVMQRPGAQLREIAVAVPGSWVKGDHKFSIKKEDLADMACNFEKRKNEMIVIDYEHASEQPEVAKGGPVPGAGWIHGLTMGARASSSQISGRDGRAPSQALTALVEWTPQAEEMLRTGQYRFFSPAIDWGAKDKETGEPQGATLTSGALTNHPFLEELPPIMLSDGTLICSAGLRPATSPLIERRYTPNTKGVTTMSEEQRKLLTDPEEKLAHKGAHALPMLKVCKGRAGSEHEGHHVFSDGDQELGCMGDADLRKHLGVNPDEQQDQQTASELHESTRHALILTEVAPDGRVDSGRATELADRGKITFVDYIRATEAEKMIDAAVREGKILPRDRKFFFRDALERPAEFAEYAKGAQAVKLGAQGFGTIERLPVDEEISLGVKKLMGDKKLDYAAAYKQFLSENPVLAEQYRAKHSVRVNADGTAS